MYLEPGVDVIEELLGAEHPVAEAQLLLVREDRRQVDHRHPQRWRQGAHGVDDLRGRPEWRDVLLTSLGQRPQRGIRPPTVELGAPEAIPRLGKERIRVHRRSQRVQRAGGRRSAGIRSQQASDPCRIRRIQACRVFGLEG